MRSYSANSDLYLKTDILLLADIFENFRELRTRSRVLLYITMFYVGCDVKTYTRINFKLTDIDMVMFIECGIRGGLSQCSGRYARANNKYDSSKPSSYLMYFDINNLYGWAMCQPLSYTDFRWINDIFNFNVMIIALDSPTCYIFEVDLEYPQDFHDAHADLSFCPTRDKRGDKLLATLR